MSMHPKGQVSPQNIDDADTSPAHLAWNLALVAGELRAQNRLFAYVHAANVVGTVEEIAPKAEEMLRLAYGSRLAEADS